MNKIFLLLAIFVTDVHATDLIDLYDRARQHNINILNNNDKVKRSQFLFKSLKKLFSILSKKRRVYDCFR